MLSSVAAKAINMNKRMEIFNGYFINKLPTTIDSIIAWLKVKTITSFTDVLSLANAPEPIYGKEYYVATNGSDSNDGLTISTPFLTINKARDTISNYKTNSGLPTGGIVVYIRGGLYKYEASLTFATTDSGEAGKPIVYRAYNDENVRIVGSQKLNNAGFTLVDSNDVNWSRLNTSSRANIYTYDLSSFSDLGTLVSFNSHGAETTIAPCELFSDSKTLDLARFPSNHKFTAPLPSLNNNTITLYGTSSPDVTGTYTKTSDNINIYKKDSLVNNKQYYISRTLGDGEHSATQDWAVDEGATNTQHWSRFGGGDRLPLYFPQPRGGTSGDGIYTIPKTFINDGWAYMEEGVDNTHFKYNNTIVPDNWVLDDIWVHGLFYHGWQDDKCPVTAIDTDTKTITVGETPLYGITTKDKLRPYYFYNVLEELTEAGEYYIDRANKKLYYIPLTDISNEEIRLSTNTTQIINIDASYVIFNGIDCEQCRLTGLNFSSSASNSKWYRGRILNTGATGAFIDGINNKILYSEITETGTKGTYVQGGVRRILTNGNNGVENCIIHDVNRLRICYQGACHLLGCGNNFEHNTIFNIKHQVLEYHGNNHNIQYNDAYNVITFGYDTGVFYTYRHWDWRGNKVNQNFIHDIRNNWDEMSISAIYKDGINAGNIANSNILSNIDGVGISIPGRSHISKYNIMKNCKYGAELLAQALTNQYNDSTYLSQMFEDNVDYTIEPWTIAYPYLATMPNDFTQIQDNGWFNSTNCEVTKNIGIGCKTFMYAHGDVAAYYKEYQATSLVEGDSNFIMPDFVNMGGIEEV